MFEEPPIVYPSEPSSFTLMATGIVTLGCYLLLSGKWQEVGLPTIDWKAWAPVWETGTRQQTYSAVGYELRFASMTDCALGRQTALNS